MLPVQLFGQDLEYALVVGETGYSLADLERRPQITFTTLTIFEDEALVFSGPSLRGLLVENGLADEAIVAHGLDGYAAVVPPELVNDNYPIIATRINGKRFGPRRKGPLWIVFPFDRFTPLQNAQLYNVSVWQLQRIDGEG
ncbi:hypothetical protein DKT77_10160 [Meridianimarinicoccus roseus]|uniref:Oxidoreductase molybdopterin-binding domain-containing protein n=2 Tax=Meridianimarinicoccus roseus TaxID=2072018 RepID=A0A2V2LF84_9RHOB|nr:hypothetical protein DKT77_10160 [Meridianimarinicoccus roseus]